MKINSVVAALLFAVTVSIHAGQFFQDFSSSAIGATNFSDGSQLFSTSYSVAQVIFSPYNELQLTASGSSGVYSAYELPDLDSATPVYAFSAKWNMPVYGNFPSAADGFSFNFGQLSSLNLATNTSLETGYGVGLSFDIQTYSGNNPGFYIRAGTNIIASSSYNPQTQWGVNTDTRHFFEVDWNYYTGISVRMDGTNKIFSNIIITNFIPQGNDRFVFAARCGASSEYIRLDNIAVVTGGNLVQLPSASPYYANNDLGSARAGAFDGDESTYWGAIFALPAYVGANFLPTNSVALYTVTSANTVSRGGDPQTFTLDGSSNGGGSWTTVGSGANCYFQLPKETHSFFTTNSTGFGAYRLNVTATSQANSGCDVGELRLYALSAVGPEKWQKLNTPSSGYTGVACSADGAIVYVTSPYVGSTIYRSVNSGQTWTGLGVFGNWAGISCSYNGKVVAAANLATSGGFIVSTNSGTNWFGGPTGLASDALPQWVAVSGNGQYILCMARNYNPFFSTNSGATWQQMPMPLNTFYGSSAGGVAASYNGNHLLAARVSSIWHSTDGGKTWGTLSATPFTGWSTLAVSADGQVIFANESGYPLHYYISSDGGGSFSGGSLGVMDDAAMSADGNRIFLASSTVFQSLDMGAHWSPANVPGGSGVACSTNGNIKYVSGGDLWKSAPPTWPPGNTPVPLTMALNNQYSVLSWPAFTPGFSLQSNTNLASTNWVNVPYPVQFNRGSTYQVTDLPTIGTKFYRLKSP